MTAGGSGAACTGGCEMTQVISQSSTQPDDIYLRLRKTRQEASEIQEHIRRIKAEAERQIAPLEEEYDRLIHICRDLAATIEHEGIQSDRYVVRGYKTRKVRSINVPALREKYPDIYAAAKPYVPDKVICEILQCSRPDWDLQGVAEDIDPKRFHAEAKIRVPVLEKIAGKARMKELEEANIIITNIITIGEPEVISRAVAEAKPRAELQETEDAE